MADLPAQRFDDPETNPYPFKNVGHDYIGPINIGEKDTTEKKLHLFLHLFNNACNPPENNDNLTTENCLIAIRK